jgi:acetoin utilization deacetylase AcuC-like enzyme
VKVGLYDDPVFLEHDAGAGHPERPERLIALREGIRREGLEGRLQLLAPRDATREELLRVHTAQHIAAVSATPAGLIASIPTPRPDRIPTPRP